VCRRCGLREVTDWYDGPGGAIEITTWLTPTGSVVGSRRVDSHQAPPPSRPLEVLDAVTERPPDLAVRRCPGHPRAWSAASERLEP
jgi:hypothetical protein